MRTRRPARRARRGASAHSSGCRCGRASARLDRSRRTPAGRSGGCSSRSCCSGCGRSPLWRRGRIVAAVEAMERLLVEDAADQPEALVQAQPRTVADGDARRLLAAVLERMQPDERGARDGRPGPPHARHHTLARSVGLVEGSASPDRCGSSMGARTSESGGSRRAGHAAIIASARGRPARCRHAERRYRRYCTAPHNGRFDVRGRCAAMHRGRSPMADRDPAPHCPWRCSASSAPSGSSPRWPWQPS